MPRWTPEETDKQVMEAVKAAVLLHPLDQLRVRRVAEEAGIPYFKVYRRWGSLDGIYHSTILSLIAQNRKAITSVETSGGSPLDTARAIMRGLTAGFDTEEYAKFMQLVLRDRHRYSWLLNYHREFLDDLATWAAGELRKSSESHGMVVVVEHRSVLEFVQSIEGDVARARLRPWAVEDRGNVPIDGSGALERLFRTVCFIQ